jgi:P2 family phage contractile tail tube protein
MNTIISNVEDFRVRDGGVVAEDVQTVTLPTIAHPTSTISGSGMAGDVDVPDGTQVTAMSYSIAHNVGANCERLSMSGVHEQECRIAKQVYDKESGSTKHQSVKIRLRGLFVSEDQGTVQRKNPNGRTANYSCLYYTEEVDGKIMKLVDIPGGRIESNGVSSTDALKSLLD